MSDHHGGDRKLPGCDFPPALQNEFLLSPEQAQYQGEQEDEGRTPPPRVMSSHSLAGEDIVLSARQSMEFPADIALSPFTPSEGTETPPISLPDPVTPPPIHNSDSNVAVNQSPLNQIIRPQPAPAATSSLSGRMRPPRVPHVSLQPTRGAQPKHGRGQSGSDYSFLSALTDSSAENNTNTMASSIISVPRRRTSSWDFNDTMDRQLRATDSPGGVTNLSTQSTPASLLQPILNDEFVAPPASIVTSDARKDSTSSHIQSSNAPKAGEILIASITSSANRGYKPILRPVGSTSTFKTENTSQRSSRCSVKHLNTGSSPVWNPTTGMDTGSFIAAPDRKEKNVEPLSPRRPRRTAAGSSNRPLKRYSVEEVLDAYPQEPPEVTQLLSQIDATRVFRAQHESHPSLMENVPPEILNDLASDPIVYSPESKQDHDSSLVTPTKKASSRDTFGDLARKLMDASPDRRGIASLGTTKPGHRRQPTLDTATNQGGKMYEAAETLFGDYVDSVSAIGSDEELGEESKKPDGDAGPIGNRRSRPRLPGRLMAFRRKARADIGYFAGFLGPHKPAIQAELSRTLRWIVFPALACATISYYVFENPPTGSLLTPPTGNPTESGLPDTDEAAEGDSPTGYIESDDSPSISWTILFGVRQVLTLEIARFTQLIVIDFFTLRTRAFPRMLGPSLSLVVAQSKGWPFLAIFWALWDFLLLYGNRLFCRHWGFWQDWITMFNTENPDGGVTASDLYKRILLSALLLGVCACVKRSVMGQIVGKRVVRRYRDEMARLMQKLIVLNDVSHLSMEMKAKVEAGAKIRSVFDDGKAKELDMPIDMTMLARENQSDSFDYSDVQSAQSKQAKNFTQSAQTEMMELLEEWEEPELQGGIEEFVTMGTILQFRRALEFIGGEYPFSPDFGSVKTRDDCVASAQAVFDRLMGGATGPFLSFETLCLVAKDAEGNVDRFTVKELIRVFRPNRDGRLSKLDFVKSVDSVYKTLRLLLASINNSQQIDRAYETIVNIIFGICASFAAMAVVGINVNAILIGVSTVIVSFAFMISTASSKYLEGILFVLVRKPYDIGDRIAIDDVNTQPSSFGSNANWIVEKVDLYTTTARLGVTRELATFSNGSLAGMRIMNLNRSEKANVLLNLKFSLDSTLQQRQMFKRRITAFVKERPRQWIKVVDFRSTRVEADLGFVEYVLLLQHREKWQTVGAILTSKGEVFNYAVELQKELNMKYKAPRVPIDIRRVSKEDSPAPSVMDLKLDSDSNDQMVVDDEPKKEK